MRTSALVRTTVVAALLVALATGCGGDDASAPATTGPGAVATTAVPTTVPVPTTESPPPAAGTIPFVTEPPSLTSTTGPEGSGCAPPSATVLPDGEWFGSVTSLDPDASVMGLDLACIYFFAAADVAAAEAGATEIPVPDDLWIGDESTNVYRLRLVPDVAVGVVPDAFSNGESLVPGGSGPDAVTPLVGRSVWVQVRDGWVVAVQQQYLP